MNKIALSFQPQDVPQDITIWSRKQSRSQLLLSRSGGEIMAYRTYCAQFYPDTLVVAGDEEKIDD